MQHVEATHPFHTSDNVADHVIPHMSHMGMTGGIREHNEAVILRPTGLLSHLESALLSPASLPLLLDKLWVVVGHGTRCRLSETGGRRGRVYQSSVFSNRQICSDG